MGILLVCSGMAYYAGMGHLHLIMEQLFECGKCLFECTQIMQYCPYP